MIPWRLYQCIKQLDIYSENEKSSHIFTTKIPVVLDITWLYKYLFSLCNKATTTLFLASRYIKTEIGKDNHYYSFIKSKKQGNFIIKSKIIVDASGYAKKVITWLWLSNNNKRIWIWVEYEFELWNNTSSRAVLFVWDQAKSWYGWIFPTNYNTLRIWIGVIKPDTDISPKKLMDNFIESNLSTKYNIKLWKLLNTNAWTLPSEKFSKKLVFWNIISVWDSANFATLTVGEWIRVCIKHWRKLWVKINEYLSWNNQALKEYEKNVINDLSSKYKFGFIINKIIARYSNKDWDNSVKRISSLNEKELSMLLRSEISVFLIIQILMRKVFKKLAFIKK